MMYSKKYFRVVLGIEYLGVNYKGWQLQTNGVITVQGVLEQAISKVANAPVSLVCAGRTDAGVHALEQVVHFDTLADRSLIEWIRGTNTYLPSDIGVSWARIVSEDFHARFKAFSRRYQYIIYNNSIGPVYLNKQVTWISFPLQINKMQEAGRSLIGNHDFNAFRSTQCQAKSSLRELYSLDIKKYEEIIIIDLCANGFLHHMVRNIVGVLIPIGAGNRPISWVDRVLNSRSRSEGGITAPPYGLYLTKIKYDSRFNLPDRNRRPYFLLKYN